MIIAPEVTVRKDIIEMIQAVISTTILVVDAYKQGKINQNIYHKSLDSIFFNATKSIIQSKQDLDTQPSVN